MRPRDHSASLRARWLAIWLLLASLSAVSVPAFGDEDLPARVGRVADAAGDLFLAPLERADEWEVIGINYPITSGDNLWVASGGRVEIDYGGGQFRLAPDTNLHVSRLDDLELALYLARGRVIVRVRVLEPDEAARVDTPYTQVQLTRPGLYRVEVTDDGRTTVAVREGEALIALSGGNQQALPGQTAIVAGPTPMTAAIQNGVSTDGFDSWSANRDRRYERSRSTAYVSRQMIGSADLDEYGTWEANPAYGGVWFPTSVAVDWAPYSDGYWTTLPGWGLTWVDAAPWGYAPFHYGRWVRIGWRWGWCPGGFIARPRWAPALVGWYGGALWSFSATGGAPIYGWVPLSWGEPYYPSWRGCSEVCWTRYNRPFAVNATARGDAPSRARFANISVAGAVTAVTGTTLAGRLPVRNHRVSVPSSLAMSAPTLPGAPDVPGHASGTVSRSGRGAGPAPAATAYPGPAAIRRRDKPPSAVEEVSSPPGAPPPTRRAAPSAVPAAGAGSALPAATAVGARAQAPAPSRSVVSTPSPELAPDVTYTVPVPRAASKATAPETRELIRAPQNSAPQPPALPVAPRTAVVTPAASTPAAVAVPPGNRGIPLPPPTGSAPAAVAPAPAAPPPLPVGQGAEAHLRTAPPGHPLAGQPGSGSANAATAPVPTPAPAPVSGPGPAPAPWGK